MVRLIALVAMTLPLMAAPPVELKVGVPFPNFELADVRTGEKKMVRNHLEKKTILHIFASW